MGKATGVPSDGDLFDQLCRDFGVGDWDEGGDVPYWKWRALEVSQVKRTRQSRGVTVEHLMLAADYCKAHHLDVRNHTWLYRHVMAAIRWDRERTAAAPSQLEEQISTAVTEAMSAGEMDWVARLTNANGTTNRSEVLNAWQHR